MYKGRGRESHLVSWSRVLTTARAPSQRLSLAGLDEFSWKDEKTVGEGVGLGLLGDHQIEQAGPFFFPKILCSVSALFLVQPFFFFVFSSLLCPFAPSIMKRPRNMVTSGSVLMNPLDLLLSRSLSPLCGKSMEREKERK